MPESKKPKHIIHDNEVYEISKSDLFHTYKKLDIPKQKPTPEWLGPRIPWDMWCEMVAWCQVTQKKFGSEALVILFFDLDKKEWKHWYPPQITQGMAVYANDDTPEYREERKAFPDLQFGTLHHHCTAKAFASGTDQKDEIDRDGFHFTVGDIGSKEHSIHFRFCLEGTCHELSPESFIEYCPETKNLPEKYRDMLHIKMIREPQDTKLWDFTEPLKNVEKKSFPQVLQKTYPPTRGIGFLENATAEPNLDTENTSPETTAEELGHVETEYIFEIVQDALWSYDFSDTPNHPNPIKRYLSVIKKKYSRLLDKENKIGLQEEVTSGVLEFLGFATKKIITEEILWVHELLKHIKNE